MFVLRKQKGRMSLGRIRAEKVIKPAEKVAKKYSEMCERRKNREKDVKIVCKNQPDAGLEPATVRFPELERTKSRTLYRLS
jgi:hypothetical protein